MTYRRALAIRLSLVEKAVRTIGEAFLLGSVSRMPLLSAARVSCGATVARMFPGAAVVAYFQLYGRLGVAPAAEAYIPDDRKSDEVAALPYGVKAGIAYLFFLVVEV